MTLSALKSIKSQLIFLLSISAMVAIGLSTAAIFIYTYQTNKTQSVKSSYLLTSILAENLPASIVFDDTQSAENILNSLKTDPSVSGAYIFKNDQQVFAAYNKEGIDTATVSDKVSEIIQANDQNKPIEFIDTQLIITSSPIYLQGEPIANLVIASDTARLNKIIRDQFFTMQAVAFIVLIFIVFWAIRLQKRFTNPIFSLKTKMDVVTKKQDFSVTIAEKREDEFQSLFDGFNIMIATINQQTNDLNKAKQEIEESHKHTRDSIEYASLIQQALVPENELFSKYFTDFFTYWRPKDVVGGDIYFFEELRNDDECLLFVIDCTGHGVPGAFVTMLVKAIERQIVSNIVYNPSEEVSPSKILSIFNRSMKHLLKQENEDSISNAGFDGAIIYVNKKQNILKYAGSNTPLFYFEDNKINTIKGDKHSIGYKKSDRDFVFKEEIIEIKPDTCFYLTTDGYLDQNGGEKGFPFGKKRFSKLIEEHHHLAFEEQKQILIAELANYQQQEDRNDDVTVIGFKF